MNTFFKARPFWTAPVWSLVPVAVVCTVFSLLAIRTQKAHVELKKLRGEITDVQNSRNELDQEVRRLRNQRDELLGTNQELRAGNEKEVKKLSDLQSEGDQFWKLAAKDRPETVSGKVINLLAADSPREKAQTLFLAGKIAMTHRDYERARSLLKDAVAQYPEYAEAFNALGLVAEKQRDTADAEVAYRKAISADRDYIYPYQNLALLLLERNDLVEARELAEKALKIKPDYKPMKDILAKAKGGSPVNGIPNKP